MSIKQRRKDAGLLQCELAAMLHVKSASVFGWESGKTKPTAANLIRMSEVLDCTTDELLGIKPRDTA